MRILGMGVTELSIISALMAFSLIIGCAFGYGTMSIAGKKGYSKGGFFALGFFFGIIGLVVALLISDKTQDSSRALDELVKYKVLLDEGAITQEEFDSRKAALLAATSQETESRDVQKKSGKAPIAVLSIVAVILGVLLLLFEAQGMYGWFAMFEYGDVPRYFPTYLLPTAALVITMLTNIVVACSSIVVLMAVLRRGAIRGKSFLIVAVTAISLTAVALIVLVLDVLLDGYTAWNLSVLVSYPGQFIQEIVFLVACLLGRSFASR